MRIDNAGNVGIGTTSPSEKLSIDAGHINLNHSTAPYMRFQRAGAEHGYVGSADALFVGTQTDFGVRAENNLVFGVSSVEHMRITSAGSVGIGTTGPKNQLGVGTLAGLDGNLGGNHLSSNVSYSAGSWKYSSAAGADRGAGAGHASPSVNEWAGPQIKPCERG